ncbi:MAG: M50 family metallopeptidase [Intrasporangiaceae bacterium]|nr:M50 family metallopeptidase [Intrasporangiaceae bacterium]
MDWPTEIADRVRPVAEAIPLEGSPLVATLVLALAVVVIGPLWRVLRIAITLVHELGHAFVGVLVGRQFTGFVVRGDMSGHAVTVGKRRGPGRIITTWAGYPMPAVVGAVMVVLAEHGYGAPLITSLVVLLALAFIRIRSVLTLLVMVAALAATAALWWWRDDALQTHVLVGAGIVLIVGAWRHLAAVAVGGPGDRGSDPAVLAQLTWLPRPVWALSFVVAIALATVVAGLTIASGLGIG